MTNDHYQDLKAEIEILKQMILQTTIRMDQATTSISQANDRAFAMQAHFVGETFKKIDKKLDTLIKKD
jgi:uncharacterized protein with HEPN domain